MRLPTTGILLLGAVALATSASAQTPPAPSAITRTVIAAAKLPTVTEVPLHFRAVAVNRREEQRLTRQQHPLSALRIDSNLGWRRDQNSKGRGRAVYR